MNAFLHNGTISRDSLPERANAKRGFSWELRQYSNSRRKTTEARDFILAIMPQYGWYKKPEAVKSMSFGEIFFDCYNQALREELSSSEEGSIGTAFTPRLTKGMVHPTLTAKESVEPTSDIPTPNTLGDFVKLLGCTALGKLQTRGLNLGRAHITHFSDAISVPHVLRAIRGSMDFSPQRWQLSYVGDLSAFDSLPETRVPPPSMPLFEESQEYQADRSRASLKKWMARMAREEIGRRMQNDCTVYEMLPDFKLNVGCLGPERQCIQG
jgi:hypothetical protein